MATRVIQRTPNLGVTVKMQPLQAAVESPVDTCTPNIQSAGWWDPATGDMSEVVTGLLIDGRPCGPWGWEARIAGELCACVVDWELLWEPVVAGSAGPVTTTAGPTLLICLRLEDGATKAAAVGAGVLTATAHVACGAVRKTLDPIYLTLTDSASSGPSSDSGCCPREIAGVGWIDWETGAYTETVANWGFDPERVIIDTARVSGVLCGCDVQWVTTWSGPAGLPPTISIVSYHDTLLITGVFSDPGVLTVEVSVTCEGVPPIILGPIALSAEG